MNRIIIAAAFLCFANLILLAGCSTKNCDDFVGSETKRQEDLDSSFSIAVPNDWSVERSKRGESSELMIKATGACEIKILMASRSLVTNEKSITPIRLIDAMLNSSVQNLKSNGQNVLDFGKYRSFKDTFPSFVIVSADPNGKRSYTSYGAVSEDRNLSIIVSSRSEQHSEKLADLIKSLVNSVEFY